MKIIATMPSWLLPCLACHAAALQITAENPLEAARSSETIEIGAAQLAPLGTADLTRVRIRDAGGKELVCQALDTDCDPMRTPDAVIFQADFPAKSTLMFTAESGDKQVFRKEQYKAYGRFVRERWDDFVWENDLIACRTYGKALETFAADPLASSAIDIWSKRTAKLVANEWYLTGDYHVDHGEGADFYSAGASRGCGGSGLWAADRLWVSRNFIHSTVLANGPLRVMFELEYAPYEAHGVSITETKRISLDAGQHFSRHQLRYQVHARPGTQVALFPTAGLKKVAGESVSADEALGWLAKWENVEKGGGQQGLALIVPPAAFEKRAEDALNHLLVTRAAEGHTATWWAGFCWDKAGHITTAVAWQAKVTAQAKALAAPIRVSIRQVADKQ